MAFGQHELRSWLSCMALVCLPVTGLGTIEEYESCLDGRDGIIMKIAVVQWYQ